MKKITLIAIIALIVACAAQKRQKPTLFLIGDSTVKNGRDNGSNGQWGWGHYLPDFFDLGKINIENHALGGTSTKTFRTKGLWDSVLVKMKPGDYVIMQFGHNDASPLDDTARARGTIRNNSDESKIIFNPILKKQETVHSYGWYIRQFIKETRAKGGIPIVCSLIPRNAWEDGKVRREGYVNWAREAAEQEHTFFIDLNKLIATAYNEMGEQEVSSRFFGPTDHTHTIKEGAIFNAGKVVAGIEQTPKLQLKKYLK